jgi:hypothetical protein
MKIIAFDPSSTCTGWALFECLSDYHGGRLLQCGDFAPGKKPTDDPEIDQLWHWSTGLLARHRPEEAVLEKANLPVKKEMNRTYFAKYCYAVAVVWLAADLCCGPHRVTAVLPTAWKGRSGKGVTLAAANMIYRQEFSAGDDNIADAVMLGDWFLDRQKMLRLNRR